MQGSTSKRKLNVTIIFSLFQCDAVRPWKATYRSTETDRGYIKYSTELKVGIMIIIIISPYWQSDQLQYYSTVIPPLYRGITAGEHSFTLHVQYRCHYRQ